MNKLEIASLIQNCNRTPKTFFFLKIHWYNIWYETACTTCKFSSNNSIEVSLVCRKNKCLSCAGAVLYQWCLFNFQKECIKLSLNEKLGKSNRPKINNLFWSCKAGLVKMSFFFNFTSILKRNLEKWDEIENLWNCIRAI